MYVCVSTHTTRQPDFNHELMSPATRRDRHSRHCTTVQCSARRIYPTALSDQCHRLQSPARSVHQ